MNDAVTLNCRLIEDHELNFAKSVAAQVIPQPRLNVWMVLIPIIFVFYFYQRERYRTGSEQFVQHYMLSRKRALEEACQAETAGRDPDLAQLTGSSRLPGEAQPAYRSFLQVLVHHYQVLLEAEGGTFAELVRAAYGSKTNYLLFCNELKQAEMDLNAALEPHMEATTEGYREAAEKIELASEEKRRQEAERIFG